MKIEQAGAHLLVMPGFTLDMFPVPSCVIDSDGNIFSANDKFLQLSENPSLVRGHLFSDVLRTNLNTSMRSILSKALIDGTFSTDIEIFKPENSKCSFELRLMHLSSKENPSDLNKRYLFAMLFEVTNIRVEEAVIQHC